MINNEEDVKNKIVLPYLNSLGISLDEVQYEKNFSFKLGKNTYKVGKRNSKKAIGFSDILYRMGDKNLFVIEVKDEDVEILNDDIEQAISYARLVHPIAPFAVVTNGKDTKILDVITKEDLTNTPLTNSRYWKNGLTLSTEEELEQRYLALKFFINYSKENLEAFTRSQVDERISALRGDKDNLTKKYIPELYLPKEDVISDFDNYLQSNSFLFGLLGEAGVGKTNTLCFLTEKYLSENIVFFFNGTELVNDIFSSIKDDCNWFFSAHLEIEEIFVRLVSLTDEKRKLIIFIDAIDEVIISDFALILNDFVKRIKKYPQIKLCISSKSTEWSKFLTIKGNPSALIDVLYPPESDLTKRDNSESNVKGIMLSRFGDDELNQLDELYRSIFHFKGDLNLDVKKELRLGFILRIFSHVYANKDVPTSINDSRLFEEYLNKILEKLDYEKGLNYLTAIARVILDEQKTNTRFDLSAGLVEETKLREMLGLNPNEKIYPELFSYNILNRVNGEDNSSYVGFYFSEFRNFIMSAKVLKLHTLSNKIFSEILEKYVQDDIGHEVLLWYLRNANYSHKKIFQDFYYTKAQVFIVSYNEMLNTNFPRIKDKFDPYTKGEIGLLIDNDFNDRLRSYSFYPLKSDNENKLQIISGKMDLDSIHRDYGVNTLRSSRSDFLSSNSEIYAREIIFKQLKDIVKKGDLYEDENEGILTEKILAIMSKYSSELGITEKSIYRHTINVEKLLPVNLKDVLNKIKYKYAQLHFEDLQRQVLIDIGKIKVNYDGKGYTYSLNKNILDSNLINRAAQDAVDKNLDIPERNISGSFPPFRVLKKSIIALNKEEIIEPLLPSPDVDSKDINSNLIRRGGDRRLIPDNVLAQYSDEQLVKYTNTFFTLFLEEYKVLIEKNFIGLGNKFKLYKSMPVLIYCQLRPHRGWSLEYGIKQHVRNEVFVELNPTTSLWKSSPKEYLTVYGSRIESILWNSDTVPLDKNLSFEKAKDNCMLRNFTYKWIKNEMEKIFA